jgi:hypothetical protein
MLSQHVLLFFGAGLVSAIDVSNLGDASEYDLVNQFLQDTIEAPDASAVSNYEGGVNDNIREYNFNISVAANASLEGIENPDGGSFSSDDVTQLTVISAQSGTDMATDDSFKACIIIFSPLRTDLSDEDNTNACFSLLEDDCYEDLSGAIEFDESCSISFDAMPDSCKIFFPADVKIWGDGKRLFLPLGVSIDRVTMEMVISC